MAFIFMSRVGPISLLTLGLCVPCISRKRSGFCAFLTHPSQPWRIKALANEAQVSVGQVHKVKGLLLEKEWLAETDLGVRLTKPQICWLPGQSIIAWISIKSRSFIPC